MIVLTGRCLQIGERAVADAEIVERQPHAVGGQATQEAVALLLEILHQHAFGDLELEPGRLEAGRLERIADRRQELAVAQLCRREVDRDGKIPAPLPPGRGLTTGLAQHPGAERPDQAVGLGRRDELARRHQPAFGMVPAHQGLDADQAPARELQLRLVVQHELAPLQRLAQLALEPAACLRFLVHRRLEEAELVAAVRLGPVEGELGMLEQRVRIRPVLREQGDADAGRGWISWPSRSNGLATVARILSARATTSAVWRICGCTSGEFVATQPGQRVGGADRGGDPLGDSAQQLIADGVAQGVVDVLEAVEIEQQDRNHAALAASTGQLLAEPIVQQGAVGQAGEPIVQGQTPDHLRAKPDRSVPERAQAQSIDAPYQHGSLGRGRRKSSSAIQRIPSYDSINYKVAKLSLFAAATEVCFLYSQK